MRLARGDRVSFKPDTGARRLGVVEAVPPLIGEVVVLLDDDPFPVNVRLDQVDSCDSSGNLVESVPTPPASRKTKKEKAVSKKKEAKELRQKAQGLGIEGYEDMGRKELKAAIAAAEAKPATKKAKTKSSPTTKAKPAAKPAAKTKKPPAKKPAAKRAAPKKSTAKTAPAKKTGPGKGKGGGGSKPGSRTRAVVPMGTNPFRPGSQLHVMFPMVLKGGKRRTIAQRLAKKVDINPYADDVKVTDEDYDKRVILGCKQLADLGYIIERKGRGLDGTIKAVIPAGKEGKIVQPKSKPAKKTTTAKAAPAKKGKPAAKKPAAKKAAPKKAAAKKAPAKKTAAKTTAKTKKKTTPKK